MTFAAGMGMGLLYKKYEKKMNNYMKKASKLIK